MSLRNVQQALLLRRRPATFSWVDHFAYIETLLASAPSRYGAYYDIAAPGGALQPNGSLAAQQWDPVHRIPNLIPDAGIGDLEFNLEAARNLFGDPGLERDTTTAIIDRQILHNDGIRYPGIPMSRGDISLWDESKSEQQNFIETVSVFTPVALPPPPEGIRSVCMIMVYSMLFREMAEMMGVDIEGPINDALNAEMPEFLLGKPGVMVSNFAEGEAPAIYFNGVQVETDIMGGQIPDDSEAIAAAIQQALQQDFGLIWGSPCMAAQKLIILPRSLNPQEITEVSRRLQAAMEVPSV